MERAGGERSTATRAPLGEPGDGSSSGVAGEDDPPQPGGRP